MKNALCFLYVLITVVYLSPVADEVIVFGDRKYNNMVWGGIYLIANIGLIGALCHWLEPEHTGNTKLMFQYLKWLSMANCIYIFICIFREKYVVIHNTGIFAYILAIGFITFLVHCALKKT